MADLTAKVRKLKLYGIPLTNVGGGLIFSAVLIFKETRTLKKNVSVYPQF